MSQFPAAVDVLGHGLCSVGAIIITGTPPEQTWNVVQEDGSLLLHPGHTTAFRKAQSIPPDSIPGCLAAAKARMGGLTGAPT